MNNTGISSLSNTYSNPVTNTARSAQSTSDSFGISDFKELLSMMMMSTGMSGGVSGASSAGLSALTGSDSSDLMSSGMSGSNMMSSMMAPMMFLLMEKMLERQIEALMKADNQQSTSQSQAEPVAKVTSSIDSEIAPSGDPATPHGRPVGGVLTQGSHAGHIALDFGIPVGTQVHSSMEGKVVYAGWNNEGYGNLVIVENGSYKTYYAHLSQIPVSIGQQVKAGETIGLSGNTGNSTGPHLHYEVRKDGAQINPTSFTLG